MPIFISYNHNDRDFVENLARNLVSSRHNVWLDRWELNAGDSLTQKIQEALTESSAILVILSKNSVESEWCKRELSAGLVRELEEKRTVVMPCIIDDCKIPLFIKDKLYADFNRNPDEAYSLIDRSISKFSNSFQGRTETPEFFTDWSLDWMLPNEETTDPFFRLTFVDHSEKFPYVVLSECKVICLGQARQKMIDAVTSKAPQPFIKSVVQKLVRHFEIKPLSVTIKDPFEKYVAWKLSVDRQEDFLVIYSYRRMGEDNGMDTLVHLDNNVRIVLEHIERANYHPQPKH